MSINFKFTFLVIAGMGVWSKTSLKAFGNLECFGISATKDKFNIGQSNRELGYFRSAVWRRFVLQYSGPFGIMLALRKEVKQYQWANFLQ